MLSRCTHCLRPLARAASARPVAAVSRRHLSLAPRPRSIISGAVPPVARTLSQGPRRTLVSVAAQPPPNPSEDFEPVDPSDLFPSSSASSTPPDLSMSLTDSAIRQIERAQSLKSDQNLALRLLVESGGCHGYQYKMAVTSTRDQDDYLFEVANSTAKLLVDAASLPLVNGSTIDYATELIGSSFRVVNNPQSKDAGCGCGVSWELKEL